MPCKIISRLTKDEDADDEDNREQQTVKCVDSRVDIMHTSVNRFALSGVIGDGENHLLKTDVAVAVAVKRIKTLFSLLLAPWAHDFDQILLV